MRNGGDRTTPTARLRARQTEQEVVELHLRGETWQKISDQLGMTRAGALKAWQRALRNMIPPEDRTAMRRVQAERLHRLRVPMFEILDSQTSEASDKIAAVRTLVRVDEREAALFGLDAPKPAEMDSEDNWRIPIEWARSLVGQGRGQTATEAIHVTEARPPEPDAPVVEATPDEHESTRGTTVGGQFTLKDIDALRG